MGYNIITQSFIQEAKDENRVHAMSIEHVTSSIQAHGIGICDTTFSVIYGKYVRKFLNMLFELMMDEGLQHCLTIEERWINKKKAENKLEIDPRYEYSRAESNY